MADVIMRKGIGLARVSESQVGAWEAVGWRRGDAAEPVKPRHRRRSSSGASDTVTDEPAAATADTVTDEPVKSDGDA